jgi:hypothetical protein
LGHAALVTFNGFLLAMPAGNLEEMAALLDRVNAGWPLLLVFPMLLGLAVGLIVLTLALWRGGIAPLWCFLATCVMFLGDFFGGAVPGAKLIVYVLCVLVTGWLAVIVLRMPPSVWDETATIGPERVSRAAMSS